MQDTSKNINWHNHRIVAVGSPHLQSFINSVTYLIGQQQLTGFPSPLVKPDGDKIPPNILTADKLLFFLITNPQDQLRKYLKRRMKEMLHFTNQNLPAGITSGPVFYPETTGITVTTEEKYLIRNDYVEYIIKLSEAVLLYKAYTDDPDFLTSDSFNLLLQVSRFWASFFSNQKNSAHWLTEKGSLEHLEKIAAETLQFTIDFIGYLKTESSWLYEDIREQNKFSEIKETNCWKKIILKERTGKGEIYDFTSFPDIKNKLSNKEYFSDYLHNLAKQYKYEKKELIIDEDTLSSIWLNIVYRCYGLIISEKKLKFMPSLPSGWKFCSLVIHYRNSVLELEITSEKMKVTNLLSIPVDIKILDKEIRIAGLSKEMFNI